MRKRLKIMRNSAKRFRRLPLLAALAVASTIAAIAAVTVISRQKVDVKEESRNQEKKSFVTQPVAAAAQPSSKSYVTVKVAGQNVQIDSQTGQMKPLSAEEAQKLAAGLKQEINQTTDGLVEKQYPNGTVSVELNSHFQNVAVARRNDDGTISESCVDNPQAAGAFFGIDPQLIDNKSTKGVTGQQRQPVKSVNSEIQ